MLHNLTSEKINSKIKQQKQYQGKERYIRFTQDIHSHIRGCMTKQRIPESLDNNATYCTTVACQ